MSKIIDFEKEKKRIEDFREYGSFTPEECEEFKNYLDKVMGVLNYKKEDEDEQE